jgi:hypothetical protein
MENPEASRYRDRHRCIRDGNPSTSAHAINRFGVVCVKNKADIAIAYGYQLANGDWHERSLQPGWEESFAHKYSKPDENKSRAGHQFDSDLRAQKQFQRSTSWHAVLQLAIVARRRAVSI